MSILTLLFLMCDLGPMAILAILILMVMVAVVLKDLFQSDKQTLKFPPVPSDASAKDWGAYENTLF